MKNTTKLLPTMFVGIAMATIASGQQTTNYVAKFGASPPSVINSLIQDNGTNVGISVSPSYKLDVNGDVNIGATTTITNGYRLGTNMFLWNRGQTTDAFVGVGAGANTTAIDNTFVGNNAGTGNTTAKENVALGFEALKT